MSGPRRPFALVLAPAPEHRPTALGIVRSLGRAGVPVALAVPPSARPTPASQSRYVMRRLVCPPMDEAPEQWKDALLAFAASCDETPVLFPSSDEYVLGVHHFRAELSRAFRYAFMEREAVVACIDKRRMLAACRSVGIETGRVIEIRDGMHAEDVARDAVFPSVLKPAMWADLTSPHPRRDRTFLQEFEQKGVSVDGPAPLAALLARAARIPIPLMLQEKVPGPASAIVHVSLYADAESRVRGLFVGRKTRQFPSEFGNACMVETAPCPEVVGMVLALIKAVGFRGVAGGIEFKRHPRTGRLHFLELNPRAAAMVSGSTAAGVNIPYLAYLDAIGEPLPDLTVGERPIRWIEGRSDLQYIHEYRKGDHTGQALPLLTYLKSLRGRRDYAYWATDDPGPWLAWIEPRVRKRLRLR